MLVKALVVMKCSSNNCFVRKCSFVFGKIVKMHFGGGGIQINIFPVEDTISDLGVLDGGIFTFFFLVLIIDVASQSIQ